MLREQALGGFTFTIYHRERMVSKDEWKEGRAGILVGKPLLDECLESRRSSGKEMVEEPSLNNSLA